MKKRHCFVWWRRGLPCPVTRRTESEEDVEDSPRAISKEQVIKESVQKPITATSPSIETAGVKQIVNPPLGDAIGEPIPLPEEHAPATVPQIIAELQNWIAEPMPLVYSKGADDALQEFYGKDIKDTWSIQEQRALSNQWSGSESGWLPSNMVQPNLSNRLGAVNEFGLATHLMKGSSLSGLGLSPWEAFTMSELASSKSVGQLLQNLEPSLNSFLNTMNSAVNSNITMGATSQILKSLPANRLPLNLRLEDYLQEIQEDPRAVEFFKTHGTVGSGAPEKGQPRQPTEVPKIKQRPISPRFKPKTPKPHVEPPLPFKQRPFRKYPPAPMMNPWDKVAMQQNYKSEIGKMLGRGWSNRLFLTNEEQRRRRKKYGSQSAAAGWWKHAHTGDSGPTGTYGTGDWFSSLHS